MPVSLVHRFLRLPGTLLLAGSEPALAAEPPARFRRAWMGLALLSLGIGWALAGVWHASWRVSESFGPPWIPAGATLAAMFAWPSRRALAALAILLGGRHRPRRLAMGLLIVLLTGAGFFCLRDYYYRTDGLPWPDVWTRPGYKLYRVLVLMPLWGAWAMMAVTQFRVPGERTEPAVAAFASGCGPMVTAAGMGLLLAGTIFYLSFLPLWQLAVPAAAIGAGLVGGLLACRATGGLTRRALLAGNLLAQIALLGAYLAVQDL